MQNWFKNILSRGNPSEMEMTLSEGNFVPRNGASGDVKTSVGCSQVGESSLANWQKR